MRETSKEPGKNADIGILHDLCVIHDIGNIMEYTLW